MLQKQEEGNISPFLHLFVAAGRHPHDFTEESRKVKAVLNTYLITYLIDFHISKIQQTASFANFQLIEVGQRRIACTLAKQLGEVRGRIADLGSHLFYSQPFRNIFFHKMYGGSHNVVRFRIGTDSIAVLLQVAQCAEKMVEDGAGIQQVLVAITHLKRTENLFKQKDAIADARMDTRLDFNRTGAGLCKMGSQAPLEVNPINGPGILLVRLVGMGLTGRQDEILVGTYRESLPPDAEPSRPLSAVDEDILRDGRLTLPEMMPGFRIIAYISDV